MFDRLYEKALEWSRHRHATGYLSALSFAESSFFPIPPDVMLAPMALAQPQRASFLAALTTIASVLGGILGYCIGMFAFEAIESFLQGHEHYWQAFQTSKAWFMEWGPWAVFLAGFSPIPYKIFTISAGAFSMAFFPFLIASFIGRGARFFLVAMLIAWGGVRLEAAIRRYVNQLGWGMVAVVACLVVIKTI